MKGCRRHTAVDGRLQPRMKKKDKNRAGQEQPQEEAQEEAKKKRALHWSDILDAAVDLIEAVVDWFH